MGGATLLAVGLGLSVTLQAAQNEIDTFMEQVLERRDENWVQLHEYVLDEREVFQVVGPGGVPLQSVDRAHSWSIPSSSASRSSRPSFAPHAVAAVRRSGRSLVPVSSASALTNAATVFGTAGTQPPHGHEKRSNAARLHVTAGVSF